LAGELLALLEGDLAAVLHVALVADEDFAHARLRVLLDFIDPSTHVVERLAVRHVVHDDDTLGAYEQFVLQKKNCIHCSLMKAQEQMNYSSCATTQSKASTKVL